MSTHISVSTIGHSTSPGRGGEKFIHPDTPPNLLRALASAVIIQAMADMLSPDDETAIDAFVFLSSCAFPLWAEAAGMVGLNPFSINPETLRQLPGMKTRAELGSPKAVSLRKAQQRRARTARKQQQPE